MVPAVGVRRSSVPLPIGSAGEARFTVALDCEPGWWGAKSLGAADGESVAGDAIGALESALAVATWTADGEGWNRCCGTDGCRGLMCPDALADAIDGPRVGFGFGIDAQGGSGCAGRGVTLVDWDLLGTGCGRFTDVPGFARAFATWDDNAFCSAIGDSGFASVSERSSFGTDGAMTAGAAMGVAVESGEGDLRSESIGGAGIATGASAAAMTESGGAWNIKRIASKAMRARSTIGCSGSPMNDGAANAASATIAGASTVAVHSLRRRAGMRVSPRTAVIAVGTMMGVAMRIGSAAWTDGAIRVIGVMGDGAPPAVAARASAQP